MTYLIDTDWIIDHLNHIERITRRLEELAPEGLALSIISLAELYEGGATFSLALPPHHRISFALHGSSSFKRARRVSMRQRTIWAL
jgi:predicted nucleic acid-binding protein